MEEARLKAVIVRVTVDGEEVVALAASGMTGACNPLVTGVPGMVT
jgi:hypothetical protein